MALKLEGIFSKVALRTAASFIPFAVVYCLVLENAGNPFFQEIKFASKLALFLSAGIPLLLSIKGAGRVARNSSAKVGKGQSNPSSAYFLFGMLALSFLLAFLKNSQMPLPTDFFIARDYFEKNSCSFSNEMSDGRIGAFWPVLYGLFNFAFGSLPTSQDIGYSALNSVVIFLVYLLSKKVFGSVNSGFVALAFMTLSEGGYGLARTGELLPQAALSLIFAVSAVRLYENPGDKGATALAGISAGLGIQNKIFFLAFLSASFLAFAAIALIRKKKSLQGG